MKQLPESTASYWTEELQHHNTFHQLKEKLRTEIAVIGGGITGVLSAFNLQKAGYQVALFEAGQILNGTTGYTTAKISSQHGLCYHQLIEDFGKVNAKRYYDANQNGLKFIQSLIEDYQIPCDYEKQDAFVYCTNKENDELLQKEYKAYQLLDIDGALVKETDLPFDVVSAIGMRNQAQFHPLKFLKRILDEYTKLGGLLFENTKIETLDDAAQQIHLKTTEGVEIDCEKVIIATHFPFNDKDGFYFSRIHPVRSYVVAADIEGDVPDGMYISAEQPTRSIRSVTINGEKNY